MTAPGRRSLTVAGGPASCLEAGAGRAMVLVHGAGGRAEVWAPQLAGLDDVARVVALDLPGHGLTAGRGRQTVDAYADWVVACLDALGLDRVVLGGHSMGGAIAQTVALRRPERLDGLLLVGTGARLRVLPRILELFGQGSPDATGLVAGLSYSLRTPPGLVVEAERALQETPPLVVLGDFVACDHFDVMGRLGAVRAPTLVVVGRDDRLTPPKYAAHLAGAIPGARLVEVDDAGHFPQLEQPAAVNAAVREFLLTLPTLAG